MTYETKDSGAREEYESGMVRDTDEGKVRYDLALDGPMFERYAELMTRGAEKYGDRNWMMALGEEELERFRQSALRHFIQWYRGDRDEDHAAAVMFNLNGAEYVRGQTGAGLPTETPESYTEESNARGYLKGCMMLNNLGDYPHFWHPSCDTEGCTIWARSVWPQ